MVLPAPFARGLGSGHVGESGIHVGESGLTPAQANTVAVRSGPATTSSTGIVSDTTVPCTRGWS